MHMLIALNVNTMEHAWEGFLPEMLERLLSVAGSVAQPRLRARATPSASSPTARIRDSDRPMRVPVGRSADQLGARPRGAGRDRPDDAGVARRR